MEPTWVRTGSKRYLCDYVKSRNPDCRGVNFQEEGWYRGNGDTFYLTEVEGGKWRMYFWRNYDSRPDFGETDVDY